MSSGRFTGLAFAGALAAAAPVPSLALECGETVSGVISLPGEVDTFEFSGAAGQRALLRLDASPTSSVAIELLGPGGGPVALSQYLPVKMSAPLPSAGLYTVRLSEGPNARGFDDYTLALLRLEGSASCDIVAAPLHCGETVSGTFTAPGLRFWSFQAEAGDAIRFVQGPPTSSVWEQIFAPDGTELLHSSTLSETGRYLVMAATDFVPSGYGFTLEAVSASFNGGSNGPPTPVCGVPDGTRTLGCGQTVSGTVSASDSDTYTFFGVAGDQVDLAPMPSGLAPELHRPGGGLTSGSSLPESGVYTVHITRLGSGTLSYGLTMNRTPCSAACNDGLDDDFDGQTDFPADAGCTSAEDFSEAPECGDQLDNDGDGATDAEDLGCVSVAAASEDPACDDGQDNDGDGGFDFDGAGSTNADAYCPAAFGGAETPPPGCGIGPELALILPLLARLRRRAR